MAEREKKSSMGSFSRGAELWMHQARLFVVAIWTAILISVGIGVAIAVAYFYKRSTVVERYALERNVVAELRLLFMMTNAKMELYVGGERQMLHVQEVSELTEPEAGEALRHLKNGAVFGGLTSIGVIFLLLLFWWNYGKGKMADQRLRGAELVDGEELARLMASRQDTSPYSLAGVPMRKGAENLHTLIAGAQGTGKSQQFFRMMRQVRARKKPAFVYDPTGEFAAAFYREGVDIILNPLDARSPNWSIWQEIERDYHFDNMANGLIPDPAEADPFWAQAGRMVLKDVYRVLGREGRRTNSDLYNSIAKSNLDTLHALLVGTAGATYVDPTTERTGMSLKMTVQNQLEAFRFLHDSGDSFSLREWVRQEDSDSWVFITARESQREAMKPVLSLWITTIIMAILDLKPIHRERIWGFLDELPTLQKLDILKLALTNTRKYGLCLVLGVQDFTQLYETYGQYLASTIVNGCQTKLLLRVTDGVAAKKLAELMGQAEMDEKEETLSYGLNSQRDGVSVFARRNLREIVLTSQILTLPDMTGYLTIPGDYPVARVTYKYEPNDQLAEGFIEREGFGISFKSKGGAGKLGGNGGAPAPGKSDTAILAQPSLFDDDEPRPAIRLNEMDPEDEITEFKRSEESVDEATSEISAGPVAPVSAPAALDDVAEPSIGKPPATKSAKRKSTAKKKPAPVVPDASADDATEPDEPEYIPVDAYMDEGDDLAAMAAEDASDQAEEAPAGIGSFELHTVPPEGSLVRVFHDCGVAAPGFVHIPPGWKREEAYADLGMTPRPLGDAGACAADSTKPADPAPEGDKPKPLANALKIKK